MMKLPRIYQLFLFIGIFLVLACFFSSKVNAYTSVSPPEDVTQPMTNYYQDVFYPAVFQTEGMNYESFINEGFKGTMAAMAVALVGPPDATESGALSALTNFIASIYTNPPASSIDYFAYMGKKLDIVSPAYAQVPLGIGFEGLRPYVGLWAAFRNAAYLFMVIILVAIGFAIMFRTKIDPQTVVTVQSALPGIVVTLILITFSYAIAGFAIDLMYVAIGLPLKIVEVFGVLKPWVGGPTEISQEISDLYTRYTQADILTTMRIITGLGARGLGQIFRSWFLLGAVGTGGLIAALVGIASTLMSGGGTALTAVTGSLPVLLGLVMSFIFFLFKILFMLIKAYVMVMILIIFGPIIILLGALPGRGGFGQWLKGLISNLAVFVTVAYLFIMADLLTRVTPGNAEIWGPPFIGWGGWNLRIAINLGVLVIAPSAAELVQSIIAGRGGPPMGPMGIPSKETGQIVSAFGYHMKGGVKSILSRLT